MDPLSAMALQSKQRKVKTNNDPLSMMSSSSSSKPKQPQTTPKLSISSTLGVAPPKQELTPITTGTLNTLSDITNPSVPLPLTKSNNSIDYNTKIPSIKGDFFSDRDLITKNCSLMKAESIRDIAQASYQNPDQSLIGVLVLTDYRLIFRFKNENLEKQFNMSADYFKLPLFHILKIDKVQDKKITYDSYHIEINLKDTRCIHFHIWDKLSSHKFYTSLMELAFPRKPEDHLIFSYTYRQYLINNDKATHFNGWKLYDAKKEYTRQGVTDNNDLGLRFSEANLNFQLCATYPKIIVEPKEMSDDELKEASNYRTKNRLPVMSYYYNGNNKKNDNKMLMGGKRPCPCIWRSSQNKGGFIGTSRSNMDEKLLGCIMSLCSKLYIYDARPYLNALANRFNGGGFENMKHYSNDPNALDVELFFCSIENIHSARNSLNKMYQLSLSNKIIDNQKFLSALESTGWYQFIYLLLKFSNEVSLRLQSNYSVLIHCSDGWDRSAQLISLSQVLIDPYYRTIEGLAVLIEKDWLSFGHQFGFRNGFYLRSHHEDQRSPIFLQWLDCLHQLLYQFPNAFEFNDALLLFLAKSYTTNLYGTFMFNSEKERVDRDAHGKTTSVWSDVMKDISKYKNVYYNSDNPLKIITPNYAYYKLHYWSDFFTENNTYLENNKFYLGDYACDNAFHNSKMFYEFNKKNDVMKYMNLQLKSENLMNVLYDVYVKVKDKPELMEKLNEKTKTYLEHFITKPEFKEIEKQKMEVGGTGVQGGSSNNNNNNDINSNSD